MQLPEKKKSAGTHGVHESADVACARAQLRARAALKAAAGNEDATVLFSTIDRAVAVGLNGVEVAQARELLVIATLVRYTNPSES